MELNTSKNNGHYKGYFGLYISSNDMSEEDKETYKKVYKFAEDMRPLLKKYKAARFKYFDDFINAQNFAENGSEGDASWSTDALYSEKQTPLKSISKQELMAFRKCIEEANVAEVESLVSQNPRYLIGTCAFPCILKEGPRYNALHIAAKAKNAEIASIILKTVSDPNTFGRLHGQEGNDKNNVKAASVLLDLYLNTPDKTLQETPLHFASKHAAANVVEVLISYPECQKDRPNKYDQTPLDIIGSREQNVPQEDIEKIRLLLTDPFYVPVLRSEDNSCQAVIGEPFSPTSPVYQKNPEDIMSPKLEVKAIAGPMAYSQAYMFKKQWKTPPRNFHGSSSPRSFHGSNTHHSFHGSNTPPSTPRSGAAAMLSPDSPGFSPARRIMIADLDRGLEKVGRCLAKEKNIGWKEYWPFLKDFADLQSKEGLEKLEAHLKERFEQEDFNRLVRIIPKEKMLAHQEAVASDNSDSSSGESGSEGEVQDSKLHHDFREKISELCSKFEKLKVKSPGNSPGSSKWTLFEKCKSDNQDSNSNLLNGSSLKLFEHWKSENQGSCADVLNEPSTTHTPYLCVEKSCQVFAKRIGDILVTNHSNNNSEGPSSANLLRTYLTQEMKHINSLIENYIDDSAFDRIPFSLLHHRLATQIVSYLISQSDKLDQVLKDLNQLIEEFSKELLNIDGTCIHGTPPSRNSRSKLQDLEVLNCLIQHCSNILSSFLRKDSGDGTLSANCQLTAEKDVKSQWELSENCYCSFVKSTFSAAKHHRSRKHSNNTYRRSMLWHRRTHSTLAFSSNEDLKSKTNFNGMFEGSSDSEEEWYDTDCSTDITSNTATRPDSDDEPMSLTAQAPELYIKRSYPCKLDGDVLEVVGSMELDLVKYPMINYWKFCVMSHPLEDREKWQQQKPDR